MVKSLRPKLVLALLGLLVAGHAGAQESKHPHLQDPSKATAKAPAVFRAKFETTKGDVLFECTRDWAPHGVDRFYNLVKIGFYNDNSLFRVAKGFVVQWGIHGNPSVAGKWKDARLPVDPVEKSNTRGRLTFAMAGGSAATRTTQVFINLTSEKNNTRLDGMGFSPICEVVDGMSVVDKFFGGYGDGKINQGQLVAKGNAYLKEKFPKLDYIKKVSITSEGGKPPKPDSGAASDGKEGGEEGGTSTTTYIIIAVVALGVLGFFLFRKGEEEERPSDPPPRKRSTKTKKKRVKKRSTKKRTASSSEGGTTKKKKKKRRKKKT